MNQTDILSAFTSWHNPFANFFASIFTFMGNEEFYFLILPLIYWCFSKQVGFRLFYVFLLSMYVNSFLKIHFAVTRPIGTDGITSLYVSSAEVGSHYPHDSFPSGHAQGSATLWGYLAYVIKRRSFTYFAFALILLISVSRLYTGLHWPIDVVVGILLGLGLVLLSMQLQQWMTATTITMKWIIVLVAPIVLLILFPQDEGVKYSAFLLGAGIGYLLEKKYVNMLISRSVWRKSVAYIIGVAVLFTLQSGLKVVFPELLAFDFVRYVLIGIWGLVGAPYVFVLLRIYRKEKIEDATGKPPFSA
ncbi:phosphatase PAP2 family protein [Bacillus alkalicellulosilyticus]|uniref:phosphatase PAP2 family protein n=1 Tax=Alkalihalobacterium alkalicellulosilyticum TaxID=1912214 RepID=UPI000996D1D4|nr:phosphatase PAP2 family protein [Bacillus alkalicellulosilyticus]